MDIMCEVNDEYTPTVIYENGTKVLYMLTLRSIYGTIHAAMLWYNFYTEKLMDLGFKINPYDRCVANAMIHGKQCTIAWHVDDNKISHADEKVVTKIIRELEKHFGSFAVARGNRHSYLGMNIEIRNDRKVAVGMIEEIKKIIADFSEEISGRVTSPATRDLYNTTIFSKALINEKKEEFHSVTQKLLYIAKRARIDIDTAVSFLCTRVTKRTEYDWWKLKRVLTWLNTTINDKRIMGLDRTGVVHTWIDASCAVHENMRGQTGGTISMGHGVLIEKSIKQKLNGKSSTETELIGMSDMLPHTLWLSYFLENQGYIIKNNILYQNNQSAIKLEKNGRNSCTGNSRHIAIR